MEWPAHPPLEGGGGVSEKMKSLSLIINIINDMSSLIIIIINYLLCLAY